MTDEKIPDEYCGPAMMALRSERQKRFAFYMGSGEQSRADCARLAGYPDHNDRAKR
jgi:hypothetical protein